MQPPARIARLRLLVDVLKQAPTDHERDQLLRSVRTRIADLEIGGATQRNGPLGRAQVTHLLARAPARAALTDSDRLAADLGC